MTELNISYALRKLQVKLNYSDEEIMRILNVTKKSLDNVYHLEEKNLMLFLNKGFDIIAITEKGYQNSFEMNKSILNNQTLPTFSTNQSLEIILKEIFSSEQ